MQPKQRRETADWGEFRAKIAADDVGIDHGIVNMRGDLRDVVDGQGAHENARHVVHDRRQDSRENAGASLVGGVIIAPAFFVLAMLVLREALGAMPGTAAIGVALAVAVALGIWVRLADL